MNPDDVLPGDPRYKYREPGTASAARNDTATEKSKGADLTLKPTRGLQLRFTVGYADVFSQPDLSSFRGYYEAAVKRGNESPSLLADAKLLLDTLDVADRATGARAAPWSASWILDYTFARDVAPLLRGVRVGVNGSWRDSYLLGISNLRELILNQARFTDKAFPALAPLGKLERIEMFRTLAGNIAAETLAAMKRLRTIKLDYTSVDDKGLVHLGALPAVEDLSIDNLNVTDKSVEALAKLSTLRRLNLYHTLITEKGFGDLKAGLPACQFVFDRDSALPTRRTR